MASSRPRRIHEPYVFAALAFALTSGFGLAAILVAALAFGWPLGSWWISSVQAHGHAQLFGWAGLFVLGVGLYFLPRLRGTVLQHQEFASPALASLALGITLRSLSQPLLGILADNSSLGSSWGLVGRLGLALGGLIELGGATLIAVMMIATLRQARPLSRDAPFTPVAPFIFTGLISFSLSVMLNAWLAVTVALAGNWLYPSSWDYLLTHLFISGFIIPLAFALAVRNLPLFMRLAFPPKKRLGLIIAAYVPGLIMRLSGYVLEQPFGSIASGLGMTTEAGAILYFIWEFDVLLRRKTPWTASRTPPPPSYIETRKPTRKNYPDYGEYGRFELLIISAFAWLVLAEGMALANGLVTLFGTLLPGGSSLLINPDAERHAITVGFITLLIFGMAVRMLPGFSGKREVADKPLVLATVWLGNLAAIFRVGPLLIPGSVASNAALGTSGAIGWLAVACLAVNLWLTFNGESKR